MRFLKMQSVCEGLRILVSYVLLAMLAVILLSCMSDTEYQLRKRQLENQAAHEPTFSPLTVEGPIKIELLKGGKVAVTAPSQPFREIPIPDGVKTQTDLIRHLVSVGAISVVGWRALDKASGDTTTNISNTGAAAE